MIFLYIGQFQSLYRVRFFLFALFLLLLPLPPCRSISPLLLATLVVTSSLREPAINTLLRFRVAETSIDAADLATTNFPRMASYPETVRPVVGVALTTAAEMVRQDGSCLVNFNSFSASPCQLVLLVPFSLRVVSSSPFGCWPVVLSAAVVAADGDDGDGDSFEADCRTSLPVIPCFFEQRLM